MARQPARKSIESRLTAVERGIKSLQASDAAIIRSMQDGFSQMESRFAHMENRLDQIYKHVLSHPFFLQQERILAMLEPKPSPLHGHSTAQ